jgi:hypothetical protein
VLTLHDARRLQVNNHLRTMPGRGRTRNWQDSLNIFEDSQIGGYQSMWDMHYMGSVISQGLQGFITVVSRLSHPAPSRNTFADDCNDIYISRRRAAGHQLDGRLLADQVVRRTGQRQVRFQVGRAHRGRARGAVIDEINENESVSYDQTGFASMIQSSDCAR